MSPETKTLVKEVVKEYIRVLPDEYEAFTKAQEMSRKELKDELARVKGDHVLERRLHEMPETLFFSIKARLTDEQFAEFTTIEGNRWFAKTFISFRSGYEV